MNHSIFHKFPFFFNKPQILKKNNQASNHIMGSQHKRPELYLPNHHPSGEPLRIIRKITKRLFTFELRESFSINPRANRWIVKVAPIYTSERTSTICWVKLSQLSHAFPHSHQRWKPPKESHLYLHFPWMKMWKNWRFSFNLDSLGCRYICLVNTLTLRSS